MFKFINKSKILSVKTLSRRPTLVKVNEGTLEGTHEENEYGGSFYSFKGIPYAEPPLGQLRFKVPQPPKSWHRVRSAKEYGPRCYQINSLAMETNGSGSEDCLYLNVYSPNLKPIKPLPVMFFIHGGGFFCGNGSDSRHGPEFLIRHDVVYVAINYRLDVLGFLCLDIEEVAGNAGLKDQVAALRWVKKNISNFGGDPENVTIFGVSAGAVSVSYHLISPMSKGLFKRAIIQSGSCISHWPVVKDPREKAISFARKLGFTSTDPYKIYEYLKSLPVEKIVKLNVPLTCDEQMLMPLGVKFSCVSEKPFGNNDTFFTGDVFDALRKGIHEDVDVMSGFTEHEGIFGLLLRGSFKGSDLFRYAEFLEFFCPAELRYHCTKKQILEIGSKMRKFYMKDHLVTKDKIWEIVKYSSLEDFTFDTIRWQKIVAKSSANKFFMYKFTCKSDVNVFTDLFQQRYIMGPGNFVPHAQECMYLFPPKSFNININLDSKEFNMIETVTKLWTNFAKFGNPTPDDSLGAHWSPYSLERQEYMDIGEKLVPGTEPEREDVQFWEDIFREYLPQHLP